MRTWRLATWRFGNLGAMVEGLWSKVGGRGEEKAESEGHER